MKSKLLCLLLVTTIALAIPSFKERKAAQAPDFTLTDIDGKKVSLSDFKGKVVYLDVWATWCMPCVYQIGKAKKIKEHFAGNKEFVFLYVSIDKDQEKWKSMVKKKNIKGVHLLSKNGDESEISSKYNISSIPHFVLIDKAGNMVPNPKWPAEEGLIEDIEKLLK